MTKRILQDMVKVRKSPPEAIRPPREREENIFPARERPKVLKTDSKYGIYFVALVSVVSLLFALSYLFSGVKITLTPKTEEIQFKKSFSASGANSSADLSFETVVLTGEQSKTILAGEQKDVKIPAKGTVVIYNSFSSSPQALDIDTRLEGSNGKLYKTDQKITVPGMKEDGKPGSVEVGIHASEGGPSYNSGPLDFKIFGFKGTPKYAKFYGRSKGDIAGGFEGKSPVVSSLDKSIAVNDLKSKLKDGLLPKIGAQIPQGFVFFKNAAFLSVDDRQTIVSASGEDMALVTIKGSLYGVLFDEKKLAKKIAETVVDKYDGSEIYIPNIRELEFSLPGAEDINFAEAKSINFSLSGTPKIVWRVDEGKFVSDLLRKEKSEFNNILSKHTSISTAKLVIRPFWKGSFPEKAEDIQIIVNYPQ